VSNPGEWKRSALGLRKTIDPRGYAVTLTLDGLGRTTQRSEEISASANAVTTFELNVHDEMTKLTDDNGSETVYTYDGFGRLAEKLYESGKTVSFEYNANGLPLEIIDQSGTEIAQSYDDADRLVSRTLTLASGVGGDTDEAFAYDAMGRLLEAQDDDDRR
jgi:YD repeat-containing protein